jgi:hypothetical protein
MKLALHEEGEKEIIDHDEKEEFKESLEEKVIATETQRNI